MSANISGYKEKYYAPLPNVESWGNNGNRNIKRDPPKGIYAPIIEKVDVKSIINENSDFGVDGILKYDYNTNPCVDVSFTGSSCHDKCVTVGSTPYKLSIDSHFMGKHIPSREEMLPINKAENTICCKPVMTHKKESIFIPKNINSIRKHILNISVKPTKTINRSKLTYTPKNENMLEKNNIDTCIDSNKTKQTSKLLYIPKHENMLQQNTIDVSIDSNKTITINKQMLDIVGDILSSSLRNENTQYSVMTQLLKRIDKGIDNVSIDIDNYTGDNIEVSINTLKTLDKNILNNTNINTENYINDNVINQCINIAKFMKKYKGIDIVDIDHGLQDHLDYSCSTKKTARNIYRHSRRHMKTLYNNLPSHQINSNKTDISRCDIDMNRKADINYNGIDNINININKTSNEKHHDIQMRDKTLRETTNRGGHMTIGGTKPRLFYENPTYEQTEKLRKKDELHNSMENNNECN
jgi:hypothetical protein